MTRARIALLILSVVAAAMISINFVGARAMLAGVNDLSKAPIARLAATAAGIDPDIFSPGYRLQPELLAQRLRAGVTGFEIDLPLAAAPVRGHVDRLDVRADGRTSVAGWAVPSDPVNQITFIGIWFRGEIVSVGRPTGLRPDVDRALDRETGRSGFALSFGLPAGAGACEVAVFTLDRELRTGWLRKIGATCPG